MIKLGKMVVSEEFYKEVLEEVKEIFEELTIVETKRELKGLNQNMLISWEQKATFS